MIYDVFPLEDGKKLMKSELPRYMITAWSDAEKMRVELFTWRGLPDFGIKYAMDVATEQCINLDLSDYQAELIKEDENV